MFATIAKTAAAALLLCVLCATSGAARAGVRGAPEGTAVAAAGLDGGHESPVTRRLWAKTYKCRHYPNICSAKRLTKRKRVCPRRGCTERFCCRTCVDSREGAGRDLGCTNENPVCNPNRNNGNGVCGPAPRPRCSESGVSDFSCDACNAGRLAADGRITVPLDTTGHTIPLDEDYDEDTWLYVGGGSVWLSFTSAIEQCVVISTVLDESTMDTVMLAYRKDKEPRCSGRDMDEAEWRDAFRLNYRHDDDTGVRGASLIAMNVDASETIFVMVEKFHHLSEECVGKVVVRGTGRPCPGEQAGVVAVAGAEEEDGDERPRTTEQKYAEFASED